MSLFTIICLLVLFACLILSIHNYRKALRLIEEHGVSQISTENLKAQKFNLLFQCVIFFGILFLNLFF